jgi:hypothetical protein
LKKLTKVKNRILNFQQQKNVILVRETDPNLVTPLIDVVTVVEMEK